MGERMKAAVAAAYTEYQCRSHERELKTATLFSRTEGSLERTFACVAVRPLADLVRAVVLLRPCGGGIVAVIHGNEQIACVAPEGADAVVQAIADEPLCAGEALAVIEEASSIVPEIVVRLLRRAGGAEGDEE